MLGTLVGTRGKKAFAAVLELHHLGSETAHLLLHPAVKDFQVHATTFEAFEP